VEEGILSCYKQESEDGQSIYLRDYFEGDYFGELALLYNTKRAASIIAKTDVVLFSLDRNTFNAVRIETHQKRRIYECFLEDIEILQSLDPYERMKIADALTKVHVPADHYIIRQVPQPL